MGLKNSTLKEFTPPLITIYTQKLKKMTTYTPHSGKTFIADELLPCPFCGGIPELKFIGNEHTRSRTAIIKCPDCRATILNSTIHQNSEIVANWTIKAWNNRLKL